MHEMVMMVEKKIGIENLHEKVKRVETLFLVMLELVEEGFALQLALEVSMAASELELWG